MGKVLQDVKDIRALYTRAFLRCPILSRYSKCAHPFEVAKKDNKPVGEAALAIDPDAPLQGATLGQRIRAAYLRAGMNRSTFARALDVHYTSVFGWEKDENAPNTANLERIAEVTGRALEELLGRDSRVVREPGIAYPALAEFIALRTAQGKPLAPGRLNEISGYRWKSGKPTVQSYAFLDAALDSVLPPEVARAQAEVTNAATQRALARGGRPLQRKS